MADETTVSPRSGGGFKGVLAWLVILGLLGVVGWLASDRNARLWHLVPDQGRLVVMRGLPLPVGRQAFEPVDPTLAAAYAPIVPPPGKPLPAERTFEERALLDQAIFDVVRGWAAEEVSSGAPPRLERAIAYLTRAEKLPGLSSTQREELADLRAESGYHEGKRLLQKAVEGLREAAERLRRTAGSRSPHASDAAALLREVEAAAEAAGAALRASGGGVPSGLPALPPPPGSAPPVAPKAVEGPSPSPPPPDTTR